MDRIYFSLFSNMNSFTSNATAFDVALNVFFFRIKYFCVTNIIAKFNQVLSNTVLDFLIAILFIVATFTSFKTLFGCFDFSFG